MSRVVDGKCYWHIREDRLSKDMDKYEIILTIERAFKIWEPYLPFEFVSAGDKSKAAIVLGFYNNGDRELPILVFLKKTLSICICTGWLAEGFRRLYK